MARPRNRNSYEEFVVFCTNTTLGWSVTRRIAYATGERMVEQGKMRRVVDGVGLHIGYQPVNCHAEAGLVKPSTDISSSTLGQAEIKANAGLMGKSRTSHLGKNREARLHPKSGELMPEMDFVERVQEKVKGWPRSANRGGDRAVRVYPKDAGARSAGTP
jgi:hypothetical protein